MSQLSESFLILGMASSGREKVLYNLLIGAFDASDKVLVCMGKSEDPFYKKIRELPFVTVRDVDDPLTDANDFNSLFLMAPAEVNLLTFLEAFSQKWKQLALPLTRILSVVDCERLARDEDKPYYEVVEHFSDVLLLNKHEKTPSQWLHAYEESFAHRHLPCIVERVKNGAVASVSVILDNEPRRMTHFFDDIDALDSMDLDADNVPDEPFVIEHKLDPYFEKNLTGDYIFQIDAK
ncbi:MAG: hypothetical protein A2Y14_00750 [Verrucomicrobia bacterium GWF2_51_19]|nr:MAG: hypothetical protein A2Y14_00750 [Verrucomicrobia bacterium GWF2_51_19]HCJ11935.1 hypothetical protein [Opitutae bacterium]